MGGEFRGGENAHCEKRLHLRRVPKSFRMHKDQLKNKKKLTCCKGI
jgi:hypothetical protein